MGSKDVFENLGRHKTVIIVVGIAVALALVGRALGGDDDTEEPLALVTTTDSATMTTTTVGETQPESVVPAIDCRILLTPEETADALAVFDRPEDERDSFLISQSEVCGETLVADESVFVRIEPGNPDDFQPDTRLLATTGERVDDLGDGALWFGGEDAEGRGEVGLLSVREDTPLGGLHFRIVLGRPDLEETAQLEIAVGLARSALPRFPGIEVEPPEPELVAFEEETPDRSHVSLFDNLLVREERGDWTMGEGLVATLGLLAGEVEAFAVLDPPDLVDNSASDVIQRAEEYVETGPDQTAKDEIARLLDRLLLTPEQLEQMSAAEPLSPSAASLLVSLMPIAQEDPADTCGLFEMTAPCLVEVLIPETEGVTTDKYSLFVTLGEQSTWSVDYADLAKQAVLESARKYESLGDMPPTTVLLLPGDGLYVHYKEDGCLVHVGDFLAAYDKSQFQQVVAREIAFCLIGEHFNRQQVGIQAETRWWTRGLANYLSGYVYPSVNFEQVKLPIELAQVELSTTLADRTWTNWVFFEHLHGALGATGIMDMIGTFPEGGDHISALAQFEGMADLFNSFERGLTDANIDDLGPGTVPYNPIAWDLGLVGPTEVPFQVPRFGVRRLHIVVPPGQYACYELTQQVEQQTFWRPGAVGAAGSWSAELPVAFEGQSVLLITTVLEGAQFKMTVIDVDDDPECRDDPPADAPSDDCELNIVCRSSRYFFDLFED